jgi:hypothetical protein
MAKEFAPDGIQFIFLYTREAHPGDNKLHHSSMEQKLQYARDFTEMWNVERPMYVDDLDGPVHRAYGTLPNMTWIINSAGHIVYKADWTDKRTVRAAVEQLVAERDLQLARTRITPYNVYWQPNRENPTAEFVGGLYDVSGERAVTEFIAAQRETNGEGAATMVERAAEQALKLRQAAPAGDD